MRALCARLFVRAPSTIALAMTAVIRQDLRFTSTLATSPGSR